MDVNVQHYVSFGKLDCSEWCNHVFIITDEEAAAYNNAVSNKIPLNTFVKAGD